MSGARFVNTSLLAWVPQRLEVTMSPGAPVWPDPLPLPGPATHLRLWEMGRHQLFSAHRDLNHAEDLAEAKGVSARWSTARVGPPAGKQAHAFSWSLPFPPSPGWGPCGKKAERGTPGETPCQATAQQTLPHIFATFHPRMSCIGNQ